MAATDARPVPIKNQAYRATFPILDADGDLVTGAASLDSEVSKDGGTFTDCTNEATEIATSSGVYYLDLTSTEMNADTVAVIIKTGTAGAKTTTLVLYPQEAGDIKVDVESISGDTVAADNLEAAFDYTAGPVPQLGIIDQGTAQSVTATTIVLRAGLTVTDDVMIGATIFIRSSTNGLYERRIITDWVSATDTATVDTWTQTPTGTIEYIVFATAPGSNSLPTPADVRQWLGTAAATPTVAGVPEVDVTHWLGTAAATPTVAGVPEVDVTHWRGTAAPAEHTAGYPVVTIKDGTGTGELNTASGVAEANLKQINDDATAAANLAKTTRAIGRGTATTGGTTTSIPTSAFVPAAAGTEADQFKGRIVTFDADTTTVALRGQSTDITANTAGATPTFTVTAMTEAPASGDTFSVT